MIGDVLLNVDGVPVTGGETMATLPDRVDFSDGATIYLRRDDAEMSWRIGFNPEHLTAYEEQIELSAEVERARRDALRKEFEDRLRGTDGDEDAPEEEPEAGDSESPAPPPADTGADAG
jgi:hypothetical protein